MRRVLFLPTLFLVILGVLGYVLSVRPMAGAVGGAALTRPAIVFCTQDDVQTLDPGKMSWANDIRVAMGLWEGLTEYQPQTLKPVPGAAEKWEVSADGKTYTFHLRANARWSNGDPVTAADFIFAWKRVLTPATGADYIGLFNVVAGAQDFTKALEDKHEPASDTLKIEAPDPHTLVVHLNAPCTYFLDLCAFPPFFPLHAGAMKPFALNPADPARGYDSTWTRPPHVVTNGPFRLVDWRFKEYLQLEPDPNYWDCANVQCERLLVKSIPNDERAALLALQTGTVDVLSFVPQGFGEDLQAQQIAGQRHDVHYRPVFGTYYFLFNCQRGPLKDKRVRQALALAVDRNEIVEKVTRMHQAPLGLLVPPDSIAGYVSPKPLTEDVERAKKLLADAGFPDGAGLPSLEMLYNNDQDIHSKISQAMAQMWKVRLGVNVTFRALERAGFRNSRRDHAFDIARGGWYGDYADPTTWLDLFRTADGNNDGQFSSAAYDALLQKAAMEADPAVRFALLRDAEQLLTQDEVPFIPLYQYGDGFMYDENKIHGIDVNVRLLTMFKWIRRAPI